MKKNGEFSHGRRVPDYALAAMEQMELYCAAHPGSPSAVRRPRLLVRGELWIALLGPSVEEGIVGIGPTVTAALRAFDAQYLAGLRPPAEAIGNNRTERTASCARENSIKFVGKLEPFMTPQGCARRSRCAPNIETICNNRC